MKIKFLMDYLLIFFILIGIFGHGEDLLLDSNDSDSSLCLESEDGCYVEETHDDDMHHEMMYDDDIHYEMMSDSDHVWNFYSGSGFWFSVFLMMVVITLLMFLIQR